MNKTEEIFHIYNSEMSELFAENTTLDFNTLPSPAIIRRMPFGGGRWYHGVIGGQPRLFTGVSAVVNRICDITGEKEYLNQWKIRVGQEEADMIAHETSVLGTFMHVLCVQMAISYRTGEKLVLFDVEFKRNFKKSMEAYSVPYNTAAQYYKRAQKGARAFHKFLVDYKFELVAAEKPVFDPETNICTPLDLVGWAFIDGESHYCNFNIKFRESAQAYDSDRIQLGIEQIIYNKCIAPLTGVPITRTFILIPKSHQAAKEECLIKEFTGKFTEEDYAHYISVLKREKKDQPLFFPDLEKTRTFTEQFILDGENLITPLPMKLKDFILSFQ